MYVTYVAAGTAARSQGDTLVGTPVRIVPGAAVGVVVVG